MDKYIVPVRSDEYVPIELQERPPSPTAAGARRRPSRRLVGLILGLTATAWLAVALSSDGAMNLETASGVEPVDGNAPDSGPADPTSGTLVVRTTRTPPAEGLALDGANPALADPEAEDATGPEAAIGSAQAVDRPSDAAGPNTGATTVHVDGSDGTSGAQAPSTTRTTAPPRDTRPTTTTTSRQTSTTQRTSTSTQATTPPANVSGPAVWVDHRAAGGGDGSTARPFRTINEGVLAVRAGETLVVRGGEYREHVNPGYRMPKGTASSRITMTNAPGERVVIKGRVILTDMDHWTIRGINVTWDSNRNDRSVEHLIIMNGGVNWEWRDSEIWGAKAYSAMLITDDPRNFAVRNNFIHDTYRTNDTNQDHLIYCACGTGGGVIERNLLVGSSNGRAIKLGGSNSSGAAVANVTIRYNTMVDNYGPSNIQLSFNTSDITIERNLMVGSQDYAENISTWKLTGSGSRASNNLGYRSPGVLENHGGIANGGGNIHRNPRLDANHVPQDGVAKAYGHRAP